jgi:hypothetical protein
VQDDDRLGPEAHAVHQLGLDLQLLDGQPADALVLGVQHGVLPGMRGEPDVQVAGEPPDLRQALGESLRLVAELRQVGMRGVGRQRRRHPIHVDPVRRGVAQHRLQAVERDAERRLGPPPPRVVGRQAAVAQDLHREAEPHSRVATRDPSARSPSRRTRRARGTPLNAP